MGTSSRIGVAAGTLGLIAVLAAGCGGGDGASSGLSCGKVQSCGGSVLGTWTIRQSCQSVTDFTQGVACPTGSLDESGKMTSGTIMFNADMTYQAIASQTGTMKFKIPLSCTQDATCDDFMASISPMPPEATTSCTNVNDVCDCTLVWSQTMTATSTGTYTTNGNILSMTSGTGGQSFSDGYCVTGNQLHLLSTDMASGAVRGDLVATK